jgi:hypothetical protein
MTEIQFCIIKRKMEISLTEYTHKNVESYLRSGSRGSSDSIVPGYGLDYRAIEFQSPAEAKRTVPVTCVFRSALGPTQPPV